MEPTSSRLPGVKDREQDLGQDDLGQDDLGQDFGQDMEHSIEIDDDELVRALFGPADANAKSMRRRFGVDLVARDGELKVVGTDESVKEATAVIQRAVHVYQRDNQLSEDAFRRILDRTEDSVAGAESLHLPRNVRARTKGQDHYLEDMRSHGITFAIGPAGTGKTFLAAAVAVGQLKAGNYRKIVLCRPAVEAGERLGFLPGDFQAKINPYLRPLYDALFNLLDVNQVRRYIDNDVIEIAPLAYMRGRTLEKSFIILDEGQNTTPGQMKMFLTRMGQGSRVVVTGDVTQVDLPRGQESGLVQAVGLLQDVDGIAVARLGRGDIVRHPIVQRIVDAYERHTQQAEGGGPSPAQVPRQEPAPRRGPAPKREPVDEA